MTRSPLPPAASVGSPRAAVIGGGAAGVAAARHLAQAGVHVTLLEAGSALGGCVRTVSFAGARIDVGAEGIHTAAPEPLKLVAELGLTEDVVASYPGATWIAGPRGLRALPAGVGPAGPTRLIPLLRSGLLGPGGLARAAMEPLLPTTGSTEDAAVGAVLTRRFGRQVVDRIIDPLLGGLHAGDVHRMSLQAATPRLAAMLQDHRSILLATRQRRADGAHGFVTLRGGLGRLFDAAADQFIGDLQLGVTARAITDTGRSGGRYRVETDTGEVDVDAVVLAVPAHLAARMLGTLGADVDPLLRPLRTASVTVALLAYPRRMADLPAAIEGTGVLVPSTSHRLLKAATFLTTKWPHLSSPHVLVRASAGRTDDTRATRLRDTELVASLANDLGELVGLNAAPLDHRVVRWPHAMPQLDVGHRPRIARVRDRLARHPAIALAGASYDGVGIASALRSGDDAAQQVLAHLTGATA